MSKKRMRMRHKNNRPIRILKQFLQKINFISSIRADDRAAIEKAERCLYDVKSTEKGKIKGCLLNQSKGKAEEEKQRKQDFLMTLVSFDEMKAQFELAVRDHPDWSVVCFDICHFSEIDEKFGFRTGRWVLEKVAALGKIKDTEC